MVSILARCLLLIVWRSSVWAIKASYAALVTGKARK